MHFAKMQNKDTIKLFEESVSIKSRNFMNYLIKIFFFSLFIFVVSLQSMNPNNTLIKAIKMLNVKKAQRALAAGADPNGYHMYEEQMLYFSFRASHTLLVRKKFKNNSQKIQKAELRMAKLLLNAGANPNSKEDLLQWPALHYATAQGYSQLVSLLLAHGANPNIPLTLHDGHDTPLIIAATLGHANIVRALLAHGAKPQFKNAARKTAMDYAQENNDQEIVGILTHHAL